MARDLTRHELTVWANFQRKVKGARSDWDTNYNRPFGSAYERARDAFLKHLKDQEKKNQADAELVMFALSLCGGAILGALFAKTAAKEVAGALAKNAAMEMTWSRGYKKAFQAVKWTSENASAKFVLGALFDEAQKRGSAELKRSLQATSEIDPLSALGRGHQEVQNRLMSYTQRQDKAVTDAGWWALTDSGEGGLNSLYETSSYLKAPQKELSIEKTANEIEAALWMKYILNRDYVEKSTTSSISAPSPSGSTSSVVTVRMPIDESPLSKSYGKNLPASNTEVSNEYLVTMRKTTSQRIVYDQVGSVVKKAIDANHKRVFGGGPFFTPGAGPYERVSLETLRLADLNLTTLSDRHAKRAQIALDEHPPLPPL